MKDRRTYYRSPKRLARMRARRRLDPEHKARARRLVEVWREKYPDKYAAHRAVRAALRSGVLVRPAECQACGKAPKPLADGRSGLRADHFQGYAPECRLVVRFVCVKCDGKNERKA